MDFQKWKIGDRSLCIRHCPHLWNSPLQPIHHAQHSYWFGNKYDELVSHNQWLCCAGWNGCSGDFHKCGQYPMDLLRLPLKLTKIDQNYFLLKKSLTICYLNTIWYGNRKRVSEVKHQIHVLCSEKCNSRHLGHHMEGGGVLRRSSSPSLQTLCHWSN